MAVDEVASTGERRGEELAFELGECGVAIGDDGGLVAGGVAHRRGPGQAVHQVVEPVDLGLRIGAVAVAAVDARHVEREGHHGAACQRQQVGGARGHGGGHHLVDDRRDDVAFVERERVAAEQAVLEPASIEVGLAVEVHDHPVHQPLALVVERLAQVALPVRVLGVGMRR